MTLLTFNPRNLFVLTFAFGIGLASCTPQQQEETKTEASAETAAPRQIKPLTPEEELKQDFDVTLPKGFSLARLSMPKGDTENPLKMIERLSMMHVKQDPWTKLDRQFIEVLLVHEDEPYHFILQQQAANVMLRNHLFGHYYQEPDNPELLKAIGFYTMQLLEAKSEDAELVYKSLRALKDFWPGDQIAQVAQATADRVQARPITSVADTTGRAKYRLTYAKSLSKMAENLNKR